jgi:hypothetical protein
MIKNYIFSKKIFVVKFSIATIISVRSTLYETSEGTRIWSRIRAYDKRIRMRIFFHQNL